MTQLTDFINQLPQYLGIFILMLSTFLIGYFSAWSLQKSKYLKELRKIKNKNSYPKLTKKEKDIDVIFTEIKPKIIEVVKQTQEVIATHPKPSVPQESKIPELQSIPEQKSQEKIAEQARTSYISYTRNKPRLNFDNFGEASPRSRQDLTKINGIGPYIEQKLNEIGIYNYDQISKFKDEDIRVLTELIDFFPGRIERDDWMRQAEDLKVK